MSATAHDDPDAATCGCVDPTVDRLRDLVAAGMDQREASRLLWSPNVPPPAALAIRSPRGWVREYVRHSFAAQFPWLRLPTPTEVSSQ